MTNNDIEHNEDAPIPVFTAATNEEAVVVCATLRAAGIAAVLQSDGLDPVMGGLDSTTRDTAAMDIYVPPSQAEVAYAILAAQAPTEEELTAEEEADPTTLEEAEREVKHA